MKDWAFTTSVEEMEAATNSLLETAQKVGADTWQQRAKNQNPHCGFGGMFYNWMYSDNPKPYGSYGNGAAMRVSACGFVASSIEEAKKLSRCVTEVTHNHPEGVKGAESVAAAICLARGGRSKEEIRDYITGEFGC